MTFTNGNLSGLNAAGGTIAHYDPPALTNSIVGRSPATSTSGPSHGGTFQASAAADLFNVIITSNTANCWP